MRITNFKNGPRIKLNPGESIPQRTIIVRVPQEREDDGDRVMRQYGLRRR